MSTRAYPFLMFTGQAERAMKLYLSVLPKSRILKVVRWGVGQPGKKGTVMRGRAQLAGQTVLFSDSPAVHDFGFTPSFSLFVDFDRAADLERAAKRLGQGGKVLMPPGDYGFSRRFTWVNDRFGVSWQLNLP
jgi:predicted 3-demethylubiquinone-9 3-methyltransferase (glyoxalase superfamily)